MRDNYEIKTFEEIVDHLSKQGRTVLRDFDYQLDTNGGYVHTLKNGEVVFIPNDLRQKAILFNTKSSFDEVVNKDIFPIDNPEKDMLDIEIERIKTFHLQADYYRNYLNKKLRFEFNEVNRESAQAYLSKVIGRKIKGLTTGTDVVALISIIGEIVKIELKGKWFLEKTYGTYNPRYEPNIYTSSGNVFFITSNIIGKVKWRVASLDDILIDAQSKMTEPIKWKKYSNARNNLIFLEASR